MSEQFDINVDGQETGIIEGRGKNDLLSGSHPIRVIAYKAETPLSTLSTGLSNYTVDLHIGEREKIGQGTFGYRIGNVFFFEMFFSRLAKCTKRNYSRHKKSLRLKKLKSKKNSNLES